MLDVDFLVLTDLSDKLSFLCCCLPFTADKLQQQAQRILESFESIWNVATWFLIFLERQMTLNYEYKGIAVNCL